jgi:opacity protein-like surface antigen
VSAGAGYAQDSEIKNNRANFDAFGTGPFSAIAVGYGFEKNWRVEFEASARRNDLKLIDFNPAIGEARADGDIRMHSLMANLYYDFFGFRGFQPHLGVGFGATRGNYDVRVRGVTYVDDEDTAIAGQFLVGASSQITERAAVSLGYRVWMGGQFQMTQPDGRPLKTDQIIHALHVGLRYDLPSPGS